MSRSEPSRGYARYTLGLLALINVFNFVDRQAITILFEPIKHDLGLSDAQLGFVAGAAFAVFYAVLGIPFGRLADVWSRRRLIALGVAAWSAMTVLSGLARSFGQLLLARIGVGVGEAAYGPAALAIISDLFPPSRRSTAQAVFASGVPIGAGLGVIIGGFVAQHYGWRSAFFLLGLPGLLLALLAWRLREPPRGSAEGTVVADVARPGAGRRVREIVFRTPTLRYHFAGLSCIVFAISGFSAWIPSFLRRYHDFSLGQAGGLAGIVFATAGLVGVMSGGWLADQMARRRADGRMRLILYGAALAAPLTVGTLFLEKTGAFIACFWMNAVISSMWFSPGTSTVHDLVEPRHRGIAIAIYFFFINILGFALGPLLVGVLSDGVDDLRRAMLICPAMGLLGAIILRFGTRHLEADRNRALALAAKGDAP
ncbi:MAG: spinster family MFS transporter [Myxococcota bacterium]